MKAWLLSCVIGVTTAVALSAIGQVAARRSLAAPAMAETDFTAAPRTAVAEARFVAVPANFTVIAKSTAMAPNALVEAAFTAAGGNALASSDETAALSQGRILAYAEDDLAPSQQDETGLQRHHSSTSSALVGAKRELPYLKYYAYSELPPVERPAKIALEAFSEIPLGTPVEEIKRAAHAFGLDPNFLKAVAKIESDFDPRERTGSYIGLFQLSRAEFKRYGSGEILNPRDNAIAAADKFVTEATLFETVTNKDPTISDLYLIHQQGWEGAAEHVEHPNQVAWKSMCATDEGKAKGERWCKRAIWGNTLPAVKRQWKSVNRLTSAAFVAMWRHRIDGLYERYADAGVQQAAR
ncbi:MAG: transglycosylase SLT domain-containing protein [Xanthobacteraceae bacterium]